MRIFKHEVITDEGTLKYTHYKNATKEPPHLCEKPREYRYLTGTTLGDPVGEATVYVLWQCVHCKRLERKDYTLENLLEKHNLMPPR